MTLAHRRTLYIAGAAVFVLALPGAVHADHAWGCYHWARSNNPVSLSVGDNVSSTWDGYLDQAVADWDASAVLDLTKVAGGTRPKNCRPTSGRVEVCNANYGNNGWLGLAQIWASGCHITQATAKMNDTYFASATYNTQGWRSLVMCQEVGHDFGLGHQDEDFNNPPITPHTCMDYHRPDPSEFENPNQHDYDELVTIYSHLDAAALAGPRALGPNADLNSPAEWGQLVHTGPGGRLQVFARNLGNGTTLLTRVIWAELEP